MSILKPGSRNLLERIVRSLSPHRLFLAIGGAFGLLFCFFTVPFLVPDEFAHLYKAYRLSQLRLLPEGKSAFEVGGELPRSFRLLEDRFLGMTMQPAARVTSQELRTLWLTPLDPEQVEFFSFKNSAIYPPAGYIPQAVGLLLGRVLGLSLLGVFYMGRVVTFLTWLWLTWLAIRLVPVHRWWMFLLALMPMTVHQAASYSVDAFLNSLSFLFFTLVLHTAYTEDARLTWKRLAVWLVLLSFITLSKPVYIVFGLFIFAVPLRKFASWKKRLVSIAFSVILPAALYFGWTALLSLQAIDQSMAANINPTLQLRAILAHPLDFLKMLIFVYFDMALPFLVETIGYYGWLNQPLPVFIYPVYIVFAIVVVLFDQDYPQVRLAKFTRLLSLGVALLGLAGIAASVYIVSNPVSHPLIEGIQGRYFIPLLPFIGLALYSQALRLPALVMKLVIPLASIWFLALGVQTVLQRIAF